MAEQFDVIVVGAGAAGVGCAIVLQDLGVSSMTLLERYEVGASFLRWPAEMRFISPSFTSNGFGLLDLNAVAIDTSPAFSLNSEHPSGREYARYLQDLARHFELPIRAGVDVLSVQPLPDDQGFVLDTSQGELRSRFVIWAAGEFQYPDQWTFPGAEHCLHNTKVAAWKDIEGDDILIIGGYESGIDAAVTLAQLGKQVSVIDARARWQQRFPDPSLVLSPYTVERLQAALPTGRIQLIEATVTRVEQTADGYAVYGSGGQHWPTRAQPILATGFIGSLVLIDDLFEWHSDYNYVLLTAHDESTKTAGLFVVGPAVRHDNIILCFIYKFRQRFAVVAQAIGTRLSLDTGALERYRQHQMFLDDLSCCDDECVC